MKEKQYEVEIHEKHSHGHWGKEHYFGWVLSSDKVANAESFALDILAGMTPRELHNESEGKIRLEPYVWHTFVPLGNGYSKYVELDYDKPIGYEEAESRFTIKARVFRG